MRLISHSLVPGDPSQPVIQQVLDATSTKTTKSKTPTRPKQPSKATQPAKAANTTRQR